MKKTFQLVVSLLFVSLVAFNCGSADVKSAGVDEIIKQLNKELEALEVEGFGGNKTVIADKIYADWSKKNLPIIKAIVPRIPAGYSLYVTGHADPDAGEAQAIKVAQGRADHMKGRLVKDLGADGAKLKTKSYGSKEYADEAKKSISENRRVEFEVGKD